MAFSLLDTGGPYSTPYERAVATGNSRVQRALESAGMNTFSKPVVYEGPTEIKKAAPAKIENKVGNLLANSAKTIENTYNDYLAAMMAGAQYANGVSAAAQAAQFNYNSILQDKSFAYNTQSAYEANQTNKELMQLAAQYNAREAQKNRDWQKMMSDTAYQRAVADMRAAGINPILAAQNGGAGIGSGANASIGAAGAAMAQGSSSSVGSYSGQSYNVNADYAMLGSILGTVGNIITEIGNSGAVDSGIKTLDSALNKMWDGLEDVAARVVETLDDASPKNWGKMMNDFWGTNGGRGLVWQNFK